MPFLSLAVAVSAVILPQAPLAGQGGGEPSSVPARLAALLSQPAPTPADEEAALERLEEAIRAWGSGDHAPAAYLADSALALLPALADWRPLLLAELLAPTGDTAGVRATLERLNTADAYLSRWSWEVLADAYEHADDPMRGGATARDHARGERNPRHASQAWLRAGRLALEAGDSAQAHEDLREALDYGPRYEGAQRAATLIHHAGWPLEAPDEIRVGRALLAARAWDPAYVRLSPYVLEGRAPVPPDRDRLLLALGEALFELRRFARSEEVLSPLTDTDAEEELRAPALYWTGRGLLSRGAVAAAESTLLVLAESHPNSPWAERGIYSLLTYELRSGFGPRARRFLDVLLRVGARSASTSSTIAQLGSSQYLSQDFPSATRTFEGYLAGSRRSADRQQAGYWAALSHDRVGNAEEAERRLEGVYEEDPLTFYGVLAGELIGAPLLPSDLPEGPAAAATGSQAEFANALLRLRVHRLVPTEGSFNDEFERLTDYFERRFGRSYEFAEALIEGGLPLQAIVLGRRIRSDEARWNLRLLRIVHPFPHKEVIVREAQQRGLDPFVVAGLIRQESAFDAEISSSAGARGLMQLMPATAREVAGSLGAPYAPELLSDPVTNLRLGMTYLASMVRRFEGKPEDVLSAYNAGPGRMRSWQREAAYRDRDVFIEHIPFRETRDYVKRVQMYARIYSALYGCADFTPCLGLDYPTVVARSPLAGGQPRTLRVD